VSKSVRRVLSGSLTKGSSTDNKKVTTSVEGLEAVASKSHQRVTTEACSYLFGDIFCRVALQETIGVVVAGADDVFDVQMNAALPLPVARYIAGFFLPMSGDVTGSGDDIINCVLLTGTTYRFTLGQTYITPLAVGTVVKVAHGCVKTQTACLENNNLLRYGGFPYVPGVTAYTAGSTLVNPS
jgi:Phage conserved hypothetical protein BR0599